MGKGPDCDYDKRNISVVIPDTDTPYHENINKLNCITQFSSSYHNHEGYRQTKCLLNVSNAVQ